MCERRESCGVRREVMYSRMSDRSRRGGGGGGVPQWPRVLSRVRGGLPLLVQDRLHCGCVRWHTHARSICIYSILQSHEDYFVGFFFQWESDESIYQGLNLSHLNLVSDIELDFCIGLWGMEERPKSHFSYWGPSQEGNTLRTKYVQKGKRHQSQIRHHKFCYIFLEENWLRLQCNQN